MISIEVQFRKDQLDAALARLNELPDDLAPERFSQDERVAFADDSVSDRRRFHAFVESATSGFFLHGRKAVFMIFFSRELIEIHSHNLNAKAGEAVLRTLAEATPMFGYAAEPAERFHRNRLVKKEEGGRTIESWVGRGIDRYIPGLYWMTWLSSDYLRLRGVDPTAVAGMAMQANEDPHGWLFKLYPKPSNWQVEAGRIDAFCLATEGMFSIERAREAFACAKGLSATSAALDEWQ